ncbi:DNA polymerase III subunit gamma/tau [bacterium]|nr:DNA polymerase III subunit gamma/tau [bacterium]
MTYEVFARKYRPGVFADLVGQEAIAQALRHAVATGRTASVYLFAGMHGVGKTSVARILAKALNCPKAKQGEPCGTCEVCESIARGDCLDVVEIDAASNSKVDDVRTLRESVGFKPASLAYKVYILDEVHRLSTSAFDALLKTFEESPPLVRFVLATTELHKVPPTILSRAQVFRFRRAGLDDIVRRLAWICEQEKLEVEEEALRMIARRARGSMRDSQKLLDQVVALAAGRARGKTVKAADVAFLLGDASVDAVARCLRAIVAGQPGELLAQVDEHVRSGGRPDALSADILEGLRGVLYLKTAGETSPLLEDVALPKEDLAPAAEALSEEALLYALQLLHEAQTTMKEAREPRIVLELALVRLARARELLPVGEVLARLERLERGGSSTASSPAPTTSAPPRARPAASAPDAPRPRETNAPTEAAKPESKPGRPRASYAYPQEASGEPSSPGTGPSPQPLRGEGAPRPALVTSAAAPASPAVAPTGSTAVAEAPVAITLETVVSSWDAVKAAVSARAVPLGMALEKSAPRALKGTRLTVAAKAKDIVWSRLAAPEGVSQLQDALALVLGAPLEVRLERVSDDDATPCAGTTIHDEHLVKLAQRILGSQPLGGGW